MNKFFLLTALFLLLGCGLVVGASAPEPDDTVAYYTLDENSGTTASDSTPNSYDGTINSATWTTGVINSGLSFDGTNDYVDIDDLSSVHNLDNYIISFWLKANPQLGTYVYSEGFSSNDNPIFGILASNVNNTKLRIFIRNNGGGTPALDYTSTVDVFNDDWVHVVWVDMNGSYSFYINNVLDNSDSYVKENKNLNRVAIGALSRISYSNYFNGSLDEFSFFDATSLTSQEVEDIVSFLYASGSPSSPQQYPFDDDFIVNISSAYLLPNSSVYPTEDDLRGYVVVNDTTSVAVNYTYFVNSVSATSGTFSGSPSGSTFTLPVLSNSEFQQFDNITFSAFAVNSSNTSQALSSPLTSAAVMIENRDPGGTISWSTITPLNASNFTGIGTFTDLDTDLINITWDIYKNASLDSSGSLNNQVANGNPLSLFTIDASTTEVGDVYTFNATIKDAFGGSFSTPLSSEAVVTNIANFTITLTDEYSSNPIVDYVFNLSYFQPVINETISFSTSSSSFVLLGEIIFSEPINADKLNNELITYNRVGGSGTSELLVNYVNASGNSAGNSFHISGDSTLTTNNRSLSISSSLGDIVKVTILGRVINGSGDLTLHNYALEYDRLQNLNFISNTSTFITPLISNESANISFSANDYFSKTYTAVPLNQSLSADLYQAIVNFVASTYFTGTPISASFTVGSHTANSINISAGEHTVLASATNYYSQNKTFTVVPLSNITVNVPLPNHLATLEAINARIGGFIPGTKTGSFYDDLGNELGNFSWSGDSTQLFLERNLFYDFQLLPVNGYASNFGLQQNYSAPGLNDTVTFGLYENNSITINFLEAQNFSNLSQQVNFTLQSDFVTFTNTTSNGTIFLEDIASGSYTLQATSNGYDPITAFVTLNNNEYIELSVFFDINQTIKTFNVLDNQNKPIDGAILTFTRVVNGETINYGQSQTDISGSAQKLLKEGLTYTVTVTKQGYNTFSGSIVPFQDTYNINLNSMSQTPFVSIFDDVTYRTRGTYNNATNSYLLELQVASISNSIQFFTINVVYDGVLYSASETQTPSGSSIFINITNINVSQQNVLNVTYSVKTVNSEVLEWKQNFLIAVFDTSDTISRFDFTNLGTGTKIFLSSAIIIILVGLGIAITRRMIGAVIMGMIGVGFCMLIGLYPNLQGIITLGVLGILLVADIATGENK